MKLFFPALLCFVLILFFQPSRAMEKSDSLQLANTALRAYRYVFSNPDSSIILANHVIAKAVEEKHRYLQGYGYYILSKANWTKANYRLSTEFGFKALHLFENSVHTHLWGEVLLGLGRTFIDLDDFDRAEHFLSTSMALSRTHGDTLLLADTYREKSMLMSEIKKYDSALYYADKGLAFYTRNKDTLNTSILFSRKAKVYYALGDYNSSTLFTRAAVRLDSLIGNQRALGITYFQAAQNAFNRQREDSAVYLLQKSISFSRKIGNLPALIKAYSFLSEIYSKHGKTAVALDNMRLVSQYKDSLYNVERNGRIQEMQLLYELETKDKTIQLLGKENNLQQQQVKGQRTLMIVMGIGVVLLAAVIVLLIRLRSLQQRTNNALTAHNKSIELQKEEIQSQAEFLQEVNQVKSKLFSVISHDVRGPIANLQGLLDLLTAKVMTPEEFTLVSDKLRTNLNSTQRTLENLLNWSLSQMDGIKTDRKAIDIEAAMHEACALMLESADRKKVSIDRQVDMPLQVLADANQLQLILRNLIHNAIKFSKMGGKVMITAKMQDTMCLVSIKDFGIGLTPHERTKLLNSQEYFTKTGTQQEKGTGLGLLLCQEFISRNGGTLEIMSVPGEGTEVLFTLMVIK